MYFFSSKISKAFFFYLLAMWGGTGYAVGEEIDPEQLIVVIQGRSTPVEQQFCDTTLPRIRQLASEQKVGFQIRKITGGVPAEILITPLIIYQNYRGRSIYQGRTNTMTRIRNFIRTSRYVPQGSGKMEKEHIAVWQIKRARVWAPIKITALTGKKPEGYVEAVFQKAAREAIYRGFRHFKQFPKVSLERADRGFYLDFHPWLSNNGVLFLSLSVFSEFHCKNPVFHTGDQPLMGRWENRDALFQEAARRMEDFVCRRMEDAFGGDGFDPVDAQLPNISWEEFGLPLPTAPKQERHRVFRTDIPNRWKLIKPDPADPPLVQFRFPPPLDRYAGEAITGSGEFELPADLKPAGAMGSVRIESGSVTMGQEDLDKVVRSSLLLDTAQFPVASFRIKSGVDEGNELAFGRVSRVTYTGEFTMKGKRSPLSAAMEIEPVISVDGERRLLIQGTFQIDLHGFAIPGPDGPEPANHIVMLDVYFSLRPADEKQASGETTHFQ